MRSTLSTWILLPKNLRCCPVSGRMDHIAVSGDFEETRNLIARIGGNPLKEKPVAHARAGKEMAQLLPSSGPVR